MAGEEGLKKIEENIDSLLMRDDRCLKQFVFSSLTFKKGFIEVDEFDKGERIKLNFAHTFGHAIETVTHYEIPHGTAVAIGMIIANYIAEKRGLLSTGIAHRSEKVLLQVINTDVLLTEYATEHFIAAMRKDKKQVSTELTAVLMTDVAKDLRIVHDLTVEEVADAVAYFDKVYRINKNGLS